jgi:hypothetical protein
MRLDVRGKIEVNLHLLLAIYENFLLRLGMSLSLFAVGAISCDLEDRGKWRGRSVVGVMADGYGAIQKMADDDD